MSPQVWIGDTFVLLFIERPTTASGTTLSRGRDLGLCPCRQPLPVHRLGVALHLTQRGLAADRPDLLRGAFALGHDPAARLRRPCGTQVSGNPAAATCLRNHALKPFLVNGRPHSLVRNVNALGALGRLRLRSAALPEFGVCTFTGLRLRFFSWVKTSQPSFFTC